VLCPEETYEIGAASLEGLLPPDLARFRYGLALARKLDDCIIDRITEGPTGDYADLYAAVNSELNDKVSLIAAMLTAHGIESLAVPATVDDSELDDSYFETLRYKISHKMTATRAGLGWIGKTDLLITHRFGPRVRLATVLTSEPVYAPGEPIAESQCGACLVCVNACPASAATGLAWAAGIDRDRFYNAYICRDYCRMISKERLDTVISLCGLCIAVCPKGREKV
jgi:epoxyqueuosine reductase QueG